MPPPNKHSWTRKEINFIKKNFFKMTNPGLARALGLTLTLVRMKCYEMGLKRMELEYWTGAQIGFLKKNFRRIGDKELAKIFQQKWPKKKGWTHKHIEKKRKYLGLNRTAEQIKVIHQRNVDNGCFLLCPVKRWQKTGIAKEGEIRMWREQSGRFVPRIKIGGKFIHWNRWMWEQLHGPIPAGMNVVFRDDNPNNMNPENLELITNQELSRRNSIKSSTGLSDNYLAGILSHGDPELRKQLKQHPEILENQRLILLLKRKIKSYAKEKRSPTAA